MKEYFFSLKKRVCRAMDAPNATNVNKSDLEDNESDCSESGVNTIKLKSAIDDEPSF